MATALIVWCAVGIAVWWALLRRTPHGLGGRVPNVEWGSGAIALGLMMLVFFGSSVFSQNKEPRTVTSERIQEGIFIYSSVVVFVLGVLIALRHSPVQAFGIAPSRPLPVLALGGVAFLATYPLVAFMSILPQWWGHAVSDGDPMVQFLRGPTTGMDKFLAIFLTIGLAPVTEELAFRGLLYGLAKRYFGPLLAMTSTALLFGAIHQNPPAIPAYFLLAVGFTLAYELTGSLWAPVLMHALFNGVSVVVILFFPEWIPNP